MLKKFVSALHADVAFNTAQSLIGAFSVRMFKCSKRLTCLQFKAACEAADALVHLHKLGVHRDIKPANLLISATGKLKLADFGIAKIRETTTARETQTSSGACGTWGYMAPGARSELQNPCQQCIVMCSGAF